MKKVIYVYVGKAKDLKKIEPATSHQANASSKMQHC